MARKLGLTGSYEADDEESPGDQEQQPGHERCLEPEDMVLGRFRPCHERECRQRFGCEARHPERKAPTT